MTTSDESMSAAGRGMDLAPLRDLLAAGQLRIVSGRVFRDRLVLRLEADCYGGGGIWDHELPPGPAWDIRWESGNGIRRKGAAVTEGPCWAIEVDVAKDVDKEDPK